MEYILDKFFDNITMSVHFKENVFIFRKKWKPWDWKTEILEEKPTKTFLQNLINQFYKEVEQDSQSFLEIDKNFSKVFQLWPYRVVVVLPPLSDGIEITAVKPVKKLTLKDYNLDDKILDLFKDRAKGILISGAPWEWKTTFAQALVEFYVQQGKIVKTIESPRDLIVPNEVTQYSFSYAPHSEIRDILLLSRPDFTIYDEVRNLDDFLLFKDLRLTWIWLVWVIHATKPIDSVQRFLGNIELWLIPQVVDTIIFISWWKISKIFTLSQVVKVPAGMVSEDLARPVVQVVDFYSDEVQYEIYTYGEQVIVVDINQISANQQTTRENKLYEYASYYLQEYISDIFNCKVIVKPKSDSVIDLYVPQDCRWKIIGKGWENILELENKLGLSINIKSIEDIDTWKEINDYEIITKWKRKYLMIYLPSNFRLKDVNLKIWDTVYTFTTDKKGQIKVKNTQLIKAIEERGEKIVLLDNYW